MLVLTRKVGESIVINIGETECVVKVVSKSGNRIKLGIEAPRQIVVTRKESESE